MKLVRNLLLAMLPMIVCVTGHTQVGDAYARAATAANLAASKTKCPETKAYCLQVAKWCNCMAQIGKTGGSTNCGNQPVSPPPCKADQIGGTGNSMNSSSPAGANPARDLQSQQQQLQQDINNAQNAATAAFESATSNGKSTSGALVDATIAGAQSISDPKMQLAYAAPGLALAGLVALSERSEAKMEARQNELSKLKGSLSTSHFILNFVSGTTSYHITNLKVIKKPNGRIKSVVRTNLYDISVTINNIQNTEDSVTIFETVNFKNIVTNADSIVINRIVFALDDLKDASAYDGNYTNGYDYSTDSYENYRYQQLDNSSIEHAFTMQGDYPQLPSGLTDVYIHAKDNGITVSTKYATRHTYILSNDDFKDAYNHKVSSYLLVFDNTNDKIRDFVDYLNAIK